MAKMKLAARLLVLITFLLVMIPLTILTFPIAVIIRAGVLADSLLDDFIKKVTTWKS